MKILEISEVDLHWLAGLMEGEGCFGIYMKTSNDGYTYPTFRIHLNMCDEDVVMKAAAIAGVGKIAGPNIPKNPKHSPFWRWNVNKRDDIYSLCVILEPLMGTRRREKIRRMIETLETQGIPAWRHGTRQGYEFHKCRCAACTANNTKRHRERRALKALKESRGQ